MRCPSSSMGGKLLCSLPWGHRFPVSAQGFVSKWPEIYPLGKLLELKSMCGAAILYLGCVEVNLQIPGIRGYTEDILMLVIPTMTYANKVPVVVSSKIIDRVMKVITKGEWARVMETWRQVHFGAVMSGSLKLSHKCTGGRALAEGGTPFHQFWPHCALGVLPG